MSFLFFPKRYVQAKRPRKEVAVRIEKNIYAFPLVSQVPDLPGPYLAPVFKSKPIITTPLWPEANPCDKLLQPIISFGLFPDNLVKTASLYDVIRE